MNQHEKKPIEELTAEDLEQVVGGASTGTPDSFLKLTSAATPSPAGGGTTSILKHQD